MRTLFHRTIVDRGLKKGWSSIKVHTSKLNLEVTYLIMYVYINVNTFLFFPLDAPRTFLSSKRLIAEEKQNVTIACTASGQPQPRVTWFKPFGSLPKDRTEVVNGTLKIYNVAKTDGGIYLCKAEKLMGAETATAQVVIFFPLRFKVRRSSTRTYSYDQLFS